MILLLSVGASACGASGGGDAGSGPRVEVVVAAMDLEGGKVVGEMVLSTRRIRRADLTEEMVLAKERSEILGATLRDGLRRGRILTWSRLRDESRKRRQSLAVQKLGRAFTLPLPHQPGITRRVMPADHVDVIAVLKNPETLEVQAMTLLRDVIVLNTGGTDWKPPEPMIMVAKPRDTLTLLVLPGEAQLLALVQRVGQLSVTLANPETYPGEDDTPVSPPVGVRELFGGKRVKQLFQRRRRTIQRKKIFRHFLRPSGYRPLSDPPHRGAP